MSFVPFSQVVSSFLLIYTFLIQYAVGNSCLFRGGNSVACIYLKLQTVAGLGHQIHLIWPQLTGESNKYDKKLEVHKNTVKEIACHPYAKHATYNVIR